MKGKSYVRWGIVNDTAQSIGRDHPTQSILANKLTSKMRCGSLNKTFQKSKAINLVDKRRLKIFGLECAHWLLMLLTLPLNSHLGKQKFMADSNDIAHYTLQLSMKTLQRCVTQTIILRRSNLFLSQSVLGSNINPLMWSIE